MERRRWRQLPIAAIDVETTGFDPERDRIIEIGIVEIVEGKVVDRYGQLVNPGTPIPRPVRELTGIRQEDVERAPAFAEIAEEVVGRLRGRCIVAYNLGFDRSFVEAELNRCGLGWSEDDPTLDPLVFARALLPWLKRKNLSEVAAELGVDLKEAHRAEDDAEAAGRVLYAFDDRLPDDLDELLRLQAQWERSQVENAAIRRGHGLDLEGGGGGAQVGEAAIIALGPAYIYGEEVDPYRALFRSLPDARTRPRSET